MLTITNFLSQSLVLLGALLPLLLLNKQLRAKRGALSKAASLADINWLLLVSVGHVALCQLSAITAIVSTALLSLYAVLIWLDAMLFVQYRIEVNRETIMWFFKGTKGLMKGIPHLLEVLKRFKPAVLIPFMAIACFIFAAMQMWAVTACLGGILWLLCGSFIETGAKSRMIWACIGGLLVSLPLIPGIPVGANGIIMLAVILAVLTLNGYATVAKAKAEFFTTPSLLPNILLSDNFSAPDTADGEPLRPYVPAIKPTQKSELFGHCKGANVILITMESLGCYVQPYDDAPVQSSLVKRFNANRWLSSQHFSLCPNTTVSTNQMYTGLYSNNPYNKPDSAYYGSEPRYIKALQQAGYHTLFLDSANTGLYDYWKLLERIGFDQVWGTDDIPANGLTADYRLWNMVDEVARQVSDKPFFLHLINDQTHMPYEVVDKQRFNQHQGSSQKALYLNAVEEVDFIIDEFLNRLAEKVDLSDTLVVFTGDHGESFGEYGYSFHSNSVIPEQTQVPFMLTHPKLESKTISHSSHFDLFPTFLDLLGIHHDIAGHGQSLALDERDKCYFFHSATLKGNTPANFSLLHENDLYWFDRLFNQIYQFKFEHGRWLAQPVKNKQWVASMLGHNLLSKGLITTEQ